MTTARSLRRAAALSILPLALFACASNAPRSASGDGTAAITTIAGGGADGATTVAGTGEAGAAGASTSSVVPADQIPADFPSAAVPVPTDGLVSAASAATGSGQQYDLTYAGSDLAALVDSARSRLVSAGFTISGDYASTVKGVPSAGFTAKNAGWQVVVGGQSGTSGANVTVSVQQL